MEETKCDCQTEQFCATCQKCGEPGHKRFRHGPEIGSWCDACYEPPYRSPIWPHMLLVIAIIAGVLFITLRH